MKQNFLPIPSVSEILTTLEEEEMQRPPQQPFYSTIIDTIMKFQV